MSSGSLIWMNPGESALTRTAKLPRGMRYGPGRGDGASSAAIREGKVSVFDKGKLGVLIYMAKQERNFLRLFFCFWFLLSWYFGCLEAQLRLINSARSFRAFFFCLFVIFVRLSSPVLTIPMLFFRREENYGVSLYPSPLIKLNKKTERVFFPNRATQHGRIFLPKI